MKSMIYFLPIVLLFSCAEAPAPPPTKEELIRKKIEDFALPNFNDPESYEFVSLEEGGSVTIADNIEYREQDAGKDISRGMSDVQRAKDAEKLLGAGSRADDIARARKAIARAEAEQDALDSLKAVFQAAGTLQDTVSTLWLWNYRANNAMGAKVIGTQMVQIGPAPDFEIHKMTDERKKLLLTPGGVPGWTEAMSAILEKYPF